MKYQSINTFSVLALAAWCNSAHTRAVIDPEIAARDSGGDLAAGVLMQGCQSDGGIVLWQPDITAGTTDQNAAGFTAKGIIKLEDVTAVKDAPITDQYSTALAAIAAWSRLNPEEVQAKFKIDQHDTTPWCILPDGKQITVKGPELKDWGYTKTHGTDFAPNSDSYSAARKIITVKDRLTRWSFYIESAMFELWGSGGRKAIDRPIEVGPMSRQYLTELTGYESVWEETNRTRIEVYMNLANLTPVIIITRRGDNVPVSYALVGKVGGTYEFWNHLEGIREPIKISNVTGVAYVKVLIANGSL